MSKSRRLIELMMTINTKKKFTVGELANEFNVSKRTILRDLQELSEAGLPLYSEVGANGGYQILKERTLPPISFSENEAVAMFFAYQSLQYYSSLPFETESISALKKFYQNLPNDLKQKINELKNRITFWTPSKDLPVPYLSELLEHALEQNVLSINYDSKERNTQRDIQPIGIYSMNGLWYCPAYCYKTKEVRLFRVDRIKNLSNAVDIKPKKNISKHTIHQYLNSFDEHDNTLPFVVKLNRRGVKRCESDFWLSKLLFVHSDGTGTIDSKINDDFISWAADFFLSCGTDASVEQPEALVLEIKDKILNLMNHYKN
ncbi:YafY family transcriptional regulator [Bacillus sp. A301a_S52]|nr:YafY family transcriptional regulator [Bacillus sp. A301a_S52]